MNRDPSNVTLFRWCAVENQKRCGLVEEIVSRTSQFSCELTRHNCLPQELVSMQRDQKLP